MIRAIHKRLEEREEGFTLIELLVVVIIIGILAAIAIPVFLNQRERAFRSAVQSDLRNLAVFAETWFTDYQDYSDDGSSNAFNITWAESNGWGKSDATVISVESTAADAFCLEGNHPSLDGGGEVWSYTNSDGLAEADC